MGQRHLWKLINAPSAYKKERGLPPSMHRNKWAKNLGLFIAGTDNL